MIAMTRLFAAVPLILLAACVPPPPATPPEDADLCKAQALQGLVGQPQSVLQSMLLPAGSRVIGPSDPVTMDFRPERLNVEIGADGRIAKVGCY
jgi:hypothetical protein